ncbi:response regulator transcription factor [Falsibacillus pallidus]|uniref:response regulator transcription factor n=1 Tax=Falsibacillus pallidus TaxID=493781 RepID=UPI003D978E7E
MKILLAEDDQRLAKLIVRMLQKEWQVVEWVENGEDAFEYAAGMHYDIVILDWMLPKMSGIEVSRKLRSSGFDGAVLMLTARGDVDDRVEGLDAGADDYLVKPFEFKELFARIRALSRRGAQNFEQEAITFKDLEIRLNQRTVHRNGQMIALTPKEFQMLELFIRNRNQVISKETIIERLWGLESDATANTVEAMVKLLRKKLNGKQYIQTVRGVGYMLSDENV